MDKKPIIAIRRENKNKWERRVALIPSDCKILSEAGIKVIVQPSEIRCYTEKQYEDNDIEIKEDISHADIIIGVKEIPMCFLYPDKTHFYFSHTLKGQSHNMPFLHDLLQKNIRLVDYECIKDTNPDQNKQQRLVAFGRFAGLAGIIDLLQGLGEFLLSKKNYTPFLHTGYSYMYPSVDEAKENIKKVGGLIKTKTLPKEICPLIFGITGTGRVSGGCQEILTLFPHEFIDQDKLHTLFEKDATVHCDRVYLTIIESKDMYLHRETNTFNKDDFYTYPQNYKSVFSEKFLPYLSVLCHAMYWNVNSDRIITLDEAKRYSEMNKFRLLAITDITCDIGGSVELMTKLTTIENPFYTIDPQNAQICDDFSKMTTNSVLYHAVDHLPAEFPLDASKHFSRLLVPFLKQLAFSNYPCNFEEQKDVPLEIINAEMTCNGKLTPKFSYLYKDLAKTMTEYKDL